MLKERLDKIRSGKIALKIKKVISSRFFPVLTAAVVLLAYFAGLEVLAIWYFCVCVTAMVILCDDAAPLICLFLFPAVMISDKHSPSPAFGSDYFFHTGVLVQAIIAIAIMCIACLSKVVFGIIYKRFKPTPLFFGLCAFGTALMLNGLFSYNYSLLGTGYGSFLAFLFVVIYMCVSCFGKLSDDAVEKIALSFVLLGAVLVIQLAVAYLTTEGLLTGGERTLAFGWGTYNNFGVLLVMCIPAAWYLSEKTKYSIPFTVAAVVLLLASVLSTSRQSILVAGIIFLFCAVLGIIKDKHRLLNIIVLSVLALAAIIFCAVKWDAVLSLFSRFFDSNFMDGNGRVGLWKLAWQNFLSSPVFGVGFYADLGIHNAAGMDIIPLMYHNTIMQLLGSCGFVGLLAYGFHRYQTVKSYIKNRSPERTCIALIVAVLLLISLLDNHIFYLFPTIIYSMLVAVLEKSEGVKESSPAEEESVPAETAEEPSEKVAGENISLPEDSVPEDNKQPF